MSHIDLSELLAYWLRERDDDDLEEHVFACDRCARDLEAIHLIGEGISASVRRGVLNTVTSRAVLNRMAREGLAIREFALRPGDEVDCAVARDDIVMVARLLGRFENAKQLAVTVDIGGQEQLRYDDLPINPAHGEINLVDNGDAVREWPSTKLTFQVLDGDTVLAEYVLHHHA
jgi:hypothetical protein